jgi:serine/threonine protein kinase
MPAPEYMALLKKTGLLSPAQWTIAEEVAARNSVPAVLSAELVRLGLLTSWQSMQLLKGQTGFVLHHYRLLEAIGRGGMGHVFKAQDSRTSGIVAIKVMSRKLSSNQNLVNRFRREIRASSRLSSPNVVRTIDAGRVGKIDFMVMEFVNGDQLDSILSRLPLIPPATACEIIRQAALGLQHAHECRMVHRDIKPGNLMIDWNADGHGVVKIMDMGLVRLDEEKEELTAVTRAGQVMGTPDYMSPEQGWNTAKVDIRSDIYGLGCTFYRMLTGRMPFPGDNPLQVLMARCSKDAPSPKLLRPEIPDAVDAVVRRMTLRDPDARYQTPADLVAALEPLCTPLTIEALRQCAREQGADEEAIVLDAASRVDLSDPQDPGYQQFLREMDTGASVDLMMTNTPSGGFALSPTFPVIQERRSISGERRGTDSNSSHRSRRAALLAMLVAAALVAAIGTFVITRQMRSPPASAQNADAEGKDNKQTGNKGTAPLTAAIAIAPPLKHAPGDQLDYDPEFEGTPPKPSSGSLTWKLVAGAPDGVTIDARTGHIRWKIPESQSSGAVPIPFMLIHIADKSETVLAHSQIVAAITSATPAFQIIPPATIPARPGQSIAYRIQAIPMPTDNGDVRFRLSGKVLEGMKIDGRGGEFRWNPKDSDIGTHKLSIELYDQLAKTTVATAPLEVIVAPDIYNLQMPRSSTQNATPGQILRIPLYPDPPPGGLGQAFNLQLDPQGLPPGVSLENGGEVLVWKVPADAAGSVKVTIKPQLLIDGMKPLDEIQPSVITINVRNANSPPPANAPDPALVAEAEDAIRKLHQKNLLPSNRRLVATLRQLLETAPPEAPAHEDLALLNVIVASAAGAKAADSLLEAVVIRRQRYGTEIPPDIVKLCSELKTSSLSDAQGDRVVEACLTLAEFTVAQARWNDVFEFLRIPAEFSKKGGRSVFPDEFAEDLARSLEAADSLRKAGGSTTEVLKGEIQTTLNKWKFQPVFRGPGNLDYLSGPATSTNPANSDAPPWNFLPERVSISGPKSSFQLGFVDPVLNAERWLFRTQVVSTSTSCRFVFGTRQDNTFTGHLLVLEPGKMGLLVPLPSTANTPPTLAASATAKWPPNSFLHDLEIRLDGRNLRVRINGDIIVNANAALLRPGSAGIMVSMENAGDQPVLELRRPRFIRLP